MDNSNAFFGAKKGLVYFGRGLEPVDDFGGFAESEKEIAGFKDGASARDGSRTGSIGRGVRFGKLEVGA